MIDFEDGNDPNVCTDPDCLRIMAHKHGDGCSRGCECRKQMTLNTIEAHEKRAAELRSELYKPTEAEMEERSKGNLLGEISNEITDAQIRGTKNPDKLRDRLSELTEAEDSGYSWNTDPHAQGLSKSLVENKPMVAAISEEEFKAMSRRARIMGMLSGGYYSMNDISAALNGLSDEEIKFIKTTMGSTYGLESQDKRMGLDKEPRKRAISHLKLAGYSKEELLEALDGLSPEEIEYFDSLVIHTKPNNEKVVGIPFVKDSSEIKNDRTSYPEKAREIVDSYLGTNANYAELSKIGPVHIYVVWFCFILGGWKALVSTSIEDGRYYEVTYNKEKDETYLDAYGKIENVVIRNGNGEKL